MGVLDTFVVLFEADSSKLEAGLKESQKQSKNLANDVKKTDENAQKLGSAFLDVAKKGAALLGIGASFTALAKGIAATAKEYHDLDKLAQRFHTTAEAIDEFRDAGNLLGISSEDTIGGLKALDSAIQDTAMGLGRAKMVFEEIGIKVQDANGKVKPTTQVMDELAGVLSKMERGKQIRVMERLGLNPALLKLFNADMVELRKRMGEIDKATGFSIDNAVKKSIEFTKASKEMWLEIKTLKLYFEKLFEGMNIAALPWITEGMKKLKIVFNDVFQFLLKHGNFAKGVLLGIAAAIAYFVVPAAVSGAIAVWAMIAPFIAVGALIVGLIVLFGLLYDDVMTFMEGGESMVGSLAKKWPIIGDIIRGIVDYLQLLASVGKAVFGLLVDLITDPKNAWENFIAAIKDGFMTFASKVPGLLELVTQIGDGFSLLGEGVTAVWDAIASAVMAAVGVVIAAIEKIRSAWAAVKSVISKKGDGEGNMAVGMMDADNDMVANIRAGQSAINSASDSPLTSQPGSKSVNSTKTNTVNIGKVEVQTQATDADGISTAIGGTMTTQMRQAVSNFDDGIRG